MDATQADLFVSELISKQIGGWLIEKRLGAGKSAVVLRALNGSTTAAIKIFHPELVQRYGKAAQLERINREKSLIGASHPNVVTILDGGECSATGLLFVVMELLPFSNLHDVLSKVPVEKIRPLLLQLANAARFLEDRALVHRDIKPENIAISDDFERLVLLDLGVMRPFGSSMLTDVNQRDFIGTLRYSPPEFLLREEEDTPTGWRAITFYQIGAVLHDLLMKKILFAEYSDPYGRLVEAVLRSNPEIYGDDDKLVHIARRALVKDPKARIELLRWEDFNIIDEPKPDVISIAERVKQRQALARTREGTGFSGPDATRNAARDRLNRLASAIETRISSILTGHGCFPPRSTQTAVDHKEHSISIVVVFERDPAIGLSEFLATEMTFNQVQDAQESSIFECRFGAQLQVTSEAKNGTISAQRVITSGTGAEMLGGSALEGPYLQAIEAAYVSLEKQPFPTVAGYVTLEIQ